MIKGFPMVGPGTLTNKMLQGQGRYPCNPVDAGQCLRCGTCQFPDIAVHHCFKDPRMGRFGKKKKKEMKAYT